MIRTRDIGCIIVDNAPFHEQLTKGFQIGHGRCPLRYRRSGGSMVVVGRRFLGSSVVPTRGGGGSKQDTPPVQSLGTPKGIDWITGSGMNANFMGKDCNIEYVQREEHTLCRKEAWEGE